MASLDTQVKKVLILGYGRMGARYHEVLNSIYPSAEFTIVDPKYNGPLRGYSSLDQVSAAELFDLAVDARPNDQRLFYLKRLAEIGIKKIIVEKPHARTIEESSQMIEIAEKFQLRVMMPYYRRLGPIFQKEIFEKAGFGDIQNIQVSAGAIGLGCNGVHIIDIANYLLESEPVEIFASLKVDSIESPRGSQFLDTSGIVHIGYSNDKKLILNIDDKNANGSVMILNFDYGRILIKEPPFDWEWYLLPESSRDGVMYRTHREIKVQPPFVYELDLLKMMKQGISDFCRGASSPSLRDGHQVLKMVAMAYHSSELKKVVSFKDSIDTKLQFNFT
jgi:predicted dehydrogenase